MLRATKVAFKDDSRVDKSRQSLPFIEETSEHLVCELHVRRASTLDLLVSKRLAVVPARVDKRSTDSAIGGRRRAGDES
jgi:hypothetical protein